jgi:hypothetical protein
MRAEDIIEGAAFEPHVLEVLRKAFDEAWAETAIKFLPDEHDIARETLAYSLVGMTRDNSSDVAFLRRAGVRAMHIAYPERFDSTSGQSGTGG